MNVAVAVHMAMAVPPCTDAPNPFAALGAGGVSSAGDCATGLSQGVALIGLAFDPYDDAAA